MLGFQAFGGGATTLTLIRRNVVEQQGWLSEAEFTRDWALVQIVPGINLLGLTILIGRRVAGAKGVALALLGLLLLSVTLTILLTALYERIQHLEVVRAALRGVIPATVGLGLLTTLQADLIARGWATEQQFVESLTIGQIAPGPNGLWVISLGYLTDGWRGAMLALIAINLPPLLVLFVDQLYRRIENHPVVEGFIRGLSLAVVGIFGMVLLGLMQNFGVDTRSVLLATAAIGLGLTRRVPVFGIIALAAVVGSVAR